MSQLVINARFLSQPITGVQRFAIEVSRELKRSKINVHFLCPEKIMHQGIADELDAEYCGTFNGTVWEQVDLPRILKKRNSPLLLNLANTGPLFYRNQALVLHDIAFIKHPEWFSSKFVLWYDFLIPLLVKKAAYLFTVSDFSKSEIIQQWPEIKDRTVNIGNGLAILPPEKDTEQAAPVKPYLLCLSGNNRRKNAESVINAMDHMHDGKLRLLVVGRSSKNFGTKDQRENTGSAASRIEFLDDVSDGQLAILYQNAEALVYPSFYEGFGLPPLEALSYGCPSVLTSIPVFKEIYEGCAIFVENSGPESIARGIERLSNEAGLKEKLLLNGTALIQKHTFKNVSERIVHQLFNSLSDQ